MMALCPNAICAIIVSFHPDADFPDRLAAVARQVGHLVVVDNSSGPTSAATLEKIAQNNACTLVVNTENHGIARALNIGIGHAAQSGYEWVLLLDQDTCVDTDMVATLIAVYQDFPDKDRLAVIGSHFHDRHRPVTNVEPGAATPQLWHEVDWVITSGSLLPVSVHTQLGPFREDFFIDFVDTEYCLRARKSGYAVIKTSAALMLHAIGASTSHSLLGMKKWTSNHSADRRYYITRNYTALLRESGDYPAGWWAVKGLLASFKSLKRIVFYEQGKIAKLGAVFQGWRDALRGKMGPRKRGKQAPQGRQA